MPSLPPRAARTTGLSLPLLLLSWAAHAEIPRTRVAGVDGARAVAVLLERGTAVAGARCVDGDRAPDTGADGIWTCGTLPVEGEVRVGLLRDGRLLDAGMVTPGRDGLAVVVAGGRVTASGDASVLPAPRPGAPGGGLATVLARVTGLGDGPAPVLRLSGPDGSSELTCRDDGTFPDAVRNDGEHGCAGPAPGDRVGIQLNGGDGRLVTFDEVAWEPAEPLHTLVVDVAAHTARAAAFALPSFAPAPNPADPVPVAEPTPPTPPTPPSVDPPKPPDADVRAPVASRDVGASGGTPLAVVAAATLFLGGGLALGRRAGRLPTSLRPLPAPPLLSGGPSLGHPAVAVRAADPGALASALLPPLARHRRVVVVAPDTLVLPPSADGPVYRFGGDAGTADCEQVEAAVRALARLPGPPVAVLVVGDALGNRGAVAGTPAEALREGLPAGIWLGVLTARPTPPGFSSWEAAGPPWAFTEGEG